mmetsp:Transcript_14643/g.31836  ORF Transcript_14643/g.31836 Transcript_14643/m.31836 type:complete len:253 (-) Transcript_14643:658-1416(-)
MLICVLVCLLKRMHTDKHLSLYLPLGTLVNAHSPSISMIDTYCPPHDQRTKHPISLTIPFYSLYTKVALFIPFFFTPAFSLSGCFFPNPPRPLSFFINVGCLASSMDFFRSSKNAFEFSVLIVAGSFVEDGLEDGLAAERDLDDESLLLLLFSLPLLLLPLLDFFFLFSSGFFNLCVCNSGCSIANFFFALSLFFFNNSLIVMSVRSVWMSFPCNFKVCNVELWLNASASILPPPSQILLSSKPISVMMLFF